MDDEKHPLSEDTSKSKLSKSTKILIGCAIVIPICLFLVSLLAVIGLTVKLVTVNRSASPADNVCMTPSCVELASTVLKTMNPSIHPCEDFYNYSCGGWEATNVIPSGNGIWGVFEQLDRSNHIAIKKILDGTKMNDVMAVELARQLYRSCMDTDNITSQGAEPLLKQLNLTGGWDLIGLHNGKINWLLIHLSILSSIHSSISNLSIHLPSIHSSISNLFIHLPSIHSSISNLSIHRFIHSSVM